MEDRREMEYECEVTADDRPKGSQRLRNATRWKALKLGVPIAVTVVFLMTTLMPGVTSAASSVSPLAPVPVGQMDPMKIPKYVNQLTSPPPVYVPTEIWTDSNGNVLQENYSVQMVAGNSQQILPAPLPKTPVWCYQGEAKDALTGAPLGVVANSPACTFEATKGVPISVTWENDVNVPQPFAVDPTIMWANPNAMVTPTTPFPPFPPGYADAQGPVPLVPHLHGGEVQSYSDGGPNSWWTYNGIHGSTYSTTAPCADNQAVYYYPNSQTATTLWYHDHAMGMTRINVMSGLAGFYLLRDQTDPIAKLLPSGKYDMPLAIQDRTFNLDGTLWFPNVGINPTIHPYWFPEFFGNAIMVNGLVWPNMNVDQGQYMFRILDGSNARFYNLYFSTGCRSR
jgi:FtsP/CotA-like multicopper oxidase with cupredoxin domain